MSLLPTHKDGQERGLSYLPLSHVAGMLLDIIAPLYATAETPSWTTMHFARPYDLSKGTVGCRLRAVKPTVFLGVPRVWEKIQAKITKIGQSTTGLKRKIAMWAKDKGEIHAQNCQLGGSGAFPSMYGLASKLVHSKVKAALGLEECKFAFTGAAPIAVETLKFFGRLGLQINEVYGMSECTGATTFSLDSCHIWGSCGFAMPGMEVKVFKVNEDGSCGAECPPAPSVSDRDDQYQGEICYRGRHIMMGYMANPALGEEHVQTITRKLNAAIDDEGWLHSGDKGIKTDTGMVKITGRYKELLIGAGGENVAPVPIEDAVKAACPAISNIMMFGDRQPYLAAMVTLKAKGNPGETQGTDELDCEIPGSDVTTISAAMSDPTTIKYITDCITEGNKEAPNRNSTIKKFTILPHDFSVEGGELTSTLKLKRSVTMEHFAEVAERTYTQKSRDAYVPFHAAGSDAVTTLTKSDAVGAVAEAAAADPVVAKSDDAPAAAPEATPEPVPAADEPVAAPEAVAAPE
jgi:long-chain-fatty-acid--CoA ligase ACSBG